MKIQRATERNDKIIRTVRRCVQAIKRLIPARLKSLYTQARARLRYHAHFLELSKELHDRGRIYLIGTPEHRNLGDHAIAAGEIAFLKDHFPDERLIEIPMFFYLAYRIRFGRLIQPDDRIVVTGGGSMGNVWPLEHEMILHIVARYPKSNIVIFPQTVWFAPKWGRERQIRQMQAILRGHRSLTVCLRESASYDLMQSLGVNCLLVPDISLYLDAEKPVCAREGVLLCLRDDREKVLQKRAADSLRAYLDEKQIPYRAISMLADKPISRTESLDAVYAMFQEFRSSRLVVTDRLHALLFCVVTNTPCVAFDNLTHKVSGAHALLNGDDRFRLADTEKSAVHTMEELLAADFAARSIWPDYSALLAALQQE